MSPKLSLSEKFNSIHSQKLLLEPSAILQSLDESTDCLLSPLGITGHQKIQNRPLEEVEK
jgi:hypothetical protein